ncbi:glycosyl hydrolase family 3 N terminal domain-containing protein [Aspergillus heteromorphus CBS 117.55]|uniref:beta-glucosidase n=1 Tax=Aspergillus heteromorphus CBS 117.55 TaxID=1448321 RepID=A0A317WEP4_9EURO|nr:glycosyl hydrolase family 3 N terminal domain-containing protein [Aspergillus heteromorphus CBS 117.55]PWY84749.1 glycosyl hydrolase family 3 N terminal domain-containing protein [Aspergillus heteromorphus CBS 117.55]
MTSPLPYRDASRPIPDRVEDLLARMTVAEKAGQMCHNMLLMGPGGTLAGAFPRFSLESTEDLVCRRQMTHFNLLGPIASARDVATWHNRLQQLAQTTRLGIPITVATDPRNHVTQHVGVGVGAATPTEGGLSQWPQTLGLAALRSPELVGRFADVARQEYLALGLRSALHPQIDLATEPRWARIHATFGEDAGLTAALAAAYIRGFQGGDGPLGPQSVATMTKHFPGGGPQQHGEDPHFAYGREQVYPGAHQDYHLRPFRAAIAAGTAQMMPYYGMPVGTDWEPVGFAFDRGVITDLLREQLGFQGVVCTDWGLVTDAQILGQPMPARAWGCEGLSELERVQKLLDAGCDQLGGESCTHHLIRLVDEGRIPETRLDASVRRILTQKFALGLFDRPFVDVDAAVALVGHPDFQREADAAQRAAYTLLTNRDALLPLSATPRMVYLEGLDPGAVAARGLQVVATPEEADLALLRLQAPYEPRPGAFEALFHAGSLAFSEAEQARQARIYRTVPTVVDLFLDRPAVVPEIAEAAAALLVSYGSSDEAFLDVVFGRAAPRGQLPFDLPSSMQAVRESREDVPYDTKDPTFRFGHGLTYATA